MLLPAPHRAVPHMLLRCHTFCSLRATLNVLLRYHNAVRALCMQVALAWPSSPPSCTIYLLLNASPPPPPILTSLPCCSIEPIASRVPYMVSVGNFEVCVPGWACVG